MSASLVGLLFSASSPILTQRPPQSWDMDLRDARAHVQAAGGMAVGHAAVVLF